MPETTSLPSAAAALALAAACLAAVPVAAADTEPVSAQTILRLLGTPAESGLATKGFRPRANPDAATRVCDPQLNARLVESTGQRGELLTRTLIVERAPRLDLSIGFKLGEADLLPDGMAQLDQLALALKDPSLANERLVLAGHTDALGDTAYNDRLSCERALSARRYLNERHQIDTSRLVPMGFGFARLKDPADPLAAVNRRVEVRRFEGLTAEAPK